MAHEWAAPVVDAVTPVKPPMVTGCEELAVE